jgi:hypothetical protein
LIGAHHGNRAVTNLGECLQFCSGTLSAEENVCTRDTDNHIFPITVSRRFTMSDQKHTVSTVAALVAGGAVIGAGLGLLFAPKAGVDTRRDVGRYAKKAQLQTTRWSRAVQSGVKEAMDRRKSLSHTEDERPRIEAA